MFRIFPDSVSISVSISVSSGIPIVSSNADLLRSSEFSEICQEIFKFSFSVSVAISQRFFSPKSRDFILSKAPSSSSEFLEISRSVEPRSLDMRETKKSLCESVTGATSSASSGFSLFSTLTGGGRWFDSGRHNFFGTAFLQ